MRRLHCLVVVSLLLVVPATMGGTTTSLPSLSELFRYEKQLVASRGENPLVSGKDAFGSDPFKIRFLPDRKQHLILLRGASEVWLTDGALNLLDRKTTPLSPAGWTLTSDGYLFTAGELSSNIQVFKIGPRELEPINQLHLAEVASVRDLVYVPSSQSLFLLDGFDRRLIQATLPNEWRRKPRIAAEIKTYPLGAGPLEIRHVANHLLINSLLEHSLLILPLTRGQPDFSRASRITHDGPIWGFDAIVKNNDLLIAATGVENRPLDRRGGEFGYIDSFLYFYKVQQKEGFYSWQPSVRENLKNYTEINLSKIQTLTPKVVKFVSDSDGSLVLWVSAFGSAKAASFNLMDGRIRLRRTFDLLPGTTDFVMIPPRGDSVSRDSHATTMIMTNSLVDGVYEAQLHGVRSEYRRVKKLPAKQGKIGWQSRVGELLFFTDLLTPNNQSEGELSRFTCEACHFEGSMDGRVHYTGRGHVFATTKTLRGLGNNVPLFSRAGDKSLAAMVLAEFRVANQKRQDQFSIEARSIPWLSQMKGVSKVLTPRDLRKAFLSFFIDYNHRPNPWRLNSKALSSKALQGLSTFRARCAHCHQAIASTRTPDSLPFEDWSARLESDGQDLIWGAPFYAKTGIKPYVHRAGARVPSLRRVQQKYPYFTNGSSPTLRHLLKRFRYRDLTAWHHYEKDPKENEGEKVKTLSANEIDALEALLRYF